MGWGEKRRGAGGPDEASIKLSKKLSSLLRHRIHENGLGDVLRPDGFVPLARVLATPGFRGASEEEVRTVVRENDKQRFAILEEGDVSYIRANQGHTIQQGLDDDAMLTPMSQHELATIGRAVHGTYRAAWDGIVSSGGLLRMARSHIHLAAHLQGQGGVVSGMRRSAQIHVWVNLPAAARAGLRFYRSANGVILTPGLGEQGLLPMHTFEHAHDAATGRRWIDGEWRLPPLEGAGSTAVMGAAGLSLRCG
jgi:2'-phosphotransferase